MLKFDGVKLELMPQAAYSFEDGPATIPVDKETLIVWHWDAQSNKTRDPLLTRRFLVARTQNGDPVSVHFSIGPKNLRYQLLPLYKDRFQQSRLSNDRKLKLRQHAFTTHTIDIETPGVDYDKYKPPKSQTENLINLTIELMVYYQLKFSQIRGHFEISPFIDRRDPGLKYLRDTRLELLKELIDRRLYHLIGNRRTWNFHKQVSLLLGEYKFNEVAHLYQKFPELAGKLKAGKAYPGVLRLERTQHSDELWRSLAPPLRARLAEQGLD